MKPSLCLSKQRALSSLLFLIPYLLIFHGSISTADTLVLNLLKSNCTGDTYEASSTFQANLNTLFTSLTSKSLLSNSSTETAGNSTDLVFGLFLCRDDLFHRYCQGCIQKAITDILQSCPRTRQGVIWYDFCELRYSDYNFFGVMDATGFNISSGDTINSTEPLEMMSNLIQQAPYQPSMSASSSSVRDSVFGQAQCTTDLSSDDCKKCLETVFAQIKSCCGDRKGWHYLSHSCSIRYESYSFLFLINEDQLLRFDCNGETYAANGTYQTNLETLLSYLNSKSLLSNSGMDSVGNEPDHVYGLFLCQGDLPSIDCLNCTKTATSQILWSCPRARQGIIWYDNCQLRYSDRNFFGVMDAVGFFLKNSIETTNSSEPLKMVSELVNVAPYQRPLMFATNATVNRSWFGLAQCTSDLSSDECGKCLKTILANVTTCCSEFNGWRYLSPSCWVRYESYSFLRVLSPQPAPDDERGGRQKRTKAVVISIASLIGAMTLLCSVFFLWRWGSQRLNGSRRASLDDFLTSESMELPLMDLVMVQASTNYFSDENKLGEGGFGPVYRGVLPDGKEIAVKRLSTTSGQGSTEFKNEVRLIAKLQHRNLIKLLGCCMEREERLLIYEYLPNKSLDSFLFDASNRSHLDWRRRLHIIEGVARGLLYLHEDSRLKVIHRDLKASNVLLDGEMNAKISDFGMATIFEGENNDVDASRIVGTYGYMAPEYALHGVFSVKSDVFSFGVLLLEILSGQKNGSKFFQQHDQTLPKYAWKLWYEDRAMEFMDPMLEDSYSTNEAWRCIHVALLCVQDDADKRPTMSSVVLMLRSEHMALPEPAEPPSFGRRKVTVLDQPSTNTRVSGSKTYSVNEVTVTEAEPR